MTKIVGIRFKDKGKSYYFDPGALTLQPGDLCVVETARGTECGAVTVGPKTVEDYEVVQPLKPVLRLADAADRRQYERGRTMEKRAAEVFHEKVRKHGLEMSLVDVEYAFDGSKILFFFTAEGRVDFRDLVKDLAGVFRTRIELRQIGVRDECRMTGGIGMCGRPFCCSQFLHDFSRVTIKSAKDQGLPLNPVKISGVCGILMCCLNYEQETYEELSKHMPRVGAQVDTPKGRGVVSETAVLSGTVRVRFTNEDGSSALETFRAEELYSPRGERFGQPKEDTEATPLPAADAATEPEPAAAESAPQRKDSPGSKPRKSKRRGGRQRSGKPAGDRGAPAAAGRGSQSE